MNPHKVVVFSEEDNMISKHESNHLVKFQDCVQAPDEETPERIILVEVINNDLRDGAVVFPLNGMISLKERQIVIKSQILRVFVRLRKFFIYFFDYCVGYHLKG